MSVRKRYLPSGWYPASPEETRSFLRELSAGPEVPPEAKKAVAVVAPHAGWGASGKTALKTLALVPETAETVVVIGGHLGPGDGVLAASEDGYETPLGPIPADLDLLDGLEGEMAVAVDVYPDNTVEVLMPMIRYLLPDAHALWLRVSPDESAVRLGNALHRLAVRDKASLAVVGSTDLTHYGPAYGFAPAGRGQEAYRWSSRENDREFIELLLEMRPEEALEHAQGRRSACSAGGAVAAMVFAKNRGVKSGTLVEYSNSFDIYPSDSFVGYAGIAYRS
ncbi:MAG TPA: AmmeMemoRadiSam system protein B [bacterium]|nr:AmmeMemoRadiSam system protein B [bacterium]HPJ72616.1 AmmeMemoRadiSam system protein B [bacterium]HPQ66132.1 AmmeMemoRadiSam system protein B [bacterium]